MSLLVLNSSSKIAQGVIRHLHKTGKYETINCADLYPNYWAVQSQIDFLHSVDKKASKTVLKDTHIQDKPDLISAVKQATHVLYITHDVYANAASKTSLIKNTAEIVSENKSNIKSFVALTPAELDHYGESNPVQTAIQSEKQARQISEQLVNIKSDLTFGPDSTVVSLLIKYLQSNQNLTFLPSTQSPAPIHTNCVAHGVATALEAGNKHQGKVFLAEGSKRVAWNDLLNILEKATQSHKVVNNSKLESVASPLTNNLLSEFFFDANYRNAMQFINKYQHLTVEGALSIKELGVNPIDFESHLKPDSFKRVDSYDQPDSLEMKVKQFIY